MSGDANSPSETTQTVPNTDTRSRLLTAAARQFARRGYEGASLRKIGDSVGIRAASIFHHFPGGKQELYRAIFDTILAEVTALVGSRASDAAGAPGPMIRGMALAFWDYFAENPDFAGIVLRESFDVEGAQVDSVQGPTDDVLGLFYAYLRNAQRGGQLPEFDPHAFTLHAMMTTVTFHGAPAIAKRVLSSELPETWARENYARSLNMFLGDADA